MNVVCTTASKWQKKKKLTIYKWRQLNIPHMESLSEFNYFNFSRFTYASIIYGDDFMFMSKSMHSTCVIWNIAPPPLSNLNNVKYFEFCEVNDSKKWFVKYIEAGKLVFRGRLQLEGHLLFKNHLHIYHANGTSVPNHGHQEKKIKKYSSIYWNIQ